MNKRMTDERLAYMKTRENSLDLNESYECVQALIAERAIVEAVELLPEIWRNTHWLSKTPFSDMGMLQCADTLDTALNRAKEKPPTSEGDS